MAHFIHPDRLSRHPAAQQQLERERDKPSAPLQQQRRSSRDEHDHRGRYADRRERESYRRPAKRPAVRIDREKVCPLLLRVFVKENAAMNAADFDFPLGDLTPGELQIYTWRDATLLELIEAIRSATPAARRTSAKIDIAFAYPSSREGGMVVKTVGSVYTGRKGPDDNMTLDDLKFEIGDFLAVSVFT
ncbi:Histone deacetylase complex subunit SAP18 [Plasmodiophora brassicae]|uniref:Histone deacetylase complex subunit SAP18 n=1 Tax=Plasmodiophora brassicae TaxID=37360 RepID=A0A0G4IJE9_PLABS|nr:hypothetical protein PBRA_004060 [Plasmodiophora brassicae]SPQ96259.1 unnamed protein product [Plasmodiophora brassicae]